MSINNSEAIALQANSHISSINRFLKSIKYEVSANFICFNNRKIIISTNKVVASSDLDIVERCVKKLDNIDPNNVISLYFFQYKSYLKTLEMLYFLENINLPITSNVIEEIIKDTYIFNDTVLVSHLHIINMSPKSDIAVIWVDIWDSQNGTKAKCFINRCFNINYYITTIRETNMNSGVSQCKNCWKWDYITFACFTHGFKC